MKQSFKLFSGMWKNIENGPFHNSRNIYPYIFDNTHLVTGKSIALGSGTIVALGLGLFGFFQVALVDKENKFTMNEDFTRARKARELELGWWQDRYWKKGDPIYLPKAKNTEWIEDNAPCDWPVEKALARLDDDEWWDKFESNRPRGWVNVLPQVFNVIKIKKNSMESSEDEDDEQGDEEETGGDSHFILPYNFYNPTSPLPSERQEYRRVMEIVNEGLPKRSGEVPELYRNDMAGCTAIIDPDGPRPVKVTFSNDWRDLSPALLSTIRERLVWKYQDDFNNYAPPQISEQLRNKWNEYLSVEINQEK